jgi:hypothetical protein
LVPVVPLKTGGGDDVLHFEETDGTGRQPGDYRNDQANSQHVFKSLSTFASYYAQGPAVSMLSFSWKKIDKPSARGHFSRQKMMMTPDSSPTGQGWFGSGSRADHPPP